MQKKGYEKPVIQSEKIRVGVFGKYGSSKGPRRIIQPAWVWGLCCRG